MSPYNGLTESFAGVACQSCRAADAGACQFHRMLPHREQLCG